MDHRHTHRLQQAAQSFIELADSLLPASFPTTPKRQTTVPLRTPRCLVSACLIGLCTRYDGPSKGNADCLRQLADYHWSPICPEQLGGMPTPRSPCRLVGGDGDDVLDGSARVIDQEGIDRSAEFLCGAQMVLAIAQLQQIDCCILKSGSPSCGLTPLTGVTAALLRRHGFRIIAV